jgi:methyltransferase-like protein/ubiquinone/menaquinone biosynthesis C-methylase UbiE
MSNPYDLVRYPGYPFPQTHPDRLATMATLFGMSPPPIGSARVLELGCCDGGNLIPMAMGLPGSKFVGVDLTEIEIAAARHTAGILGLENIEFHAMDVMDLPASLGEFDYIVAHGFYSWVPEPVRDRLLAVTKAMLRPQGVAYISYNTLPGGHLRLILREMMLFHTKGLGAPAETLRKAREYLSFVVATASGNQIYQSFIAKEVESTLGRPDFGLYHDELERVHHSIYFHQFVEHASRFGLRFLSEASYFDMRPADQTIRAMKVFQDLGDDPILREQYLDFARCRRFRQTLLCHSDVPVETTILTDRMKSMLIASSARFVSSDGGAEEFEGLQTSRIKTSHSGAKAILHALIDAWPRAVPFESLPAAGSNPADVCELLNTLFGAGMVEVRTTQPTLCVDPGQRPAVSPLARIQAANARPLTNLLHSTVVPAGELESRLISLLDGTRTLAALASELAPLLQVGKSTVEFEAELEVSLKALGRLGLLVS